MRDGREPTDRPDLRAMGSAELEALVQRLGEPRYRAKQIFRWLHQRGARRFEEMSDLPKELRARLDQEARIDSMSPDRVQVARDGTRKYAFRTATGDIVESVFIPAASAGRRNSLCISSQVGCALDCGFCLTASLGLVRNLNAGEIAEQLLRVREDLVSSQVGREVHNLVLMGMGEPLQNYEEVIKAIGLITSAEGGGLSPRRVTVSTVGIVPKIEALGRDSKVNLAISLNATTDEVRDRIMPINRKWNIRALIEAARRFPVEERRRITFEYVLLHGVNDSMEDAQRLAKLVGPLGARVNLIPYNEHPYSEFERPPDAGVQAFRAVLTGRRIRTFVRTPRGDDISAACGQLGVEVEAPRRKSALAILD